jgi:TP901 family phage tail tape measure protein
MAMTGAPRVFFDVVGTFNASRMIADSKAQMLIVEAVVLDSMSQMFDSIAGIGESITRLTSTVTPLAMALSTATIEFEKFAGENKELAQGIIDTGMAFGFTAEESLAAGAKMAQLTGVIGEAAVETATKLGQTFALISGMGTEQAMTRMINLQQQTKFMYGGLTEEQFKHLDAQNQQNTVYANTIEVLDQLNTVENNSASNMKQLTFVMNQFASQAHRTGESIAYMAAMSATLIEAGEEQGKAGRALRMIYGRLGSNMQKNNDLLAEYGIATHDVTTGALRPLSAIVEDLGEVWHQLSAEIQQNIVQTVAGNDHYVRFVKLIQNHNRMSELAKMAIDEQSTATDELNRVLDDSSTAYKEAQAELGHYQAILGQKLLPSMTAATNVQAKFTKGLASFGDTAVFKGMSTFVLEMQQWMTIMGSTMQMYMQMKSVNISMETHRTVLRAINGEEIMRTDEYRKQGIFSGVTLKSAGEYAKITNLGILTEIARTKNQENLMHIQDAITMKYKQQEEMKIRIAHHEIEALGLLERDKGLRTELLYMHRTEDDIISSKLNKSRMQAALSEQLTGTERMKLVGAQATNRMELDGLSILMRRSEIAHAVAQAEMATFEVLTQKQKEYNLEQQKMGNYRQREGQKTLIILRLEASIQEATATIERERLKAKVAAAGQLQGMHQTDIQIKVQELTLGQRLLEQDTQARLILEGEAAAKARINAMDTEKINQMIQLGILRDEMHLLHEQEINDLVTLTIAENNLELVRDSALMQQTEQAMATRRNLFGMKSTDAAMARMTGRLGQMSMAAGMASIAVGVFGSKLGLDDEKSARIQIILMTLSMIPATFQMAAMSQQMLTTAVAGSELAVTNTGVAWSFAGITAAARTATGAMLTFIKSCLPLLAITAAVFAVAWALEKFAGDATKATDTVDGMNDSLRMTTDLLGSLTAESAKVFEVPAALANEFGDNVDLTNMSIAQMNDHLAYSNHLLEEYAEHQAVYGQDDPMFHHWQNQTNDLLSYNEALKQNKLVRSGEELGIAAGGGEYFETLIRQINQGAHGQLDFSPEGGLMKHKMMTQWGKGIDGPVELTGAPQAMQDPFFGQHEETIAEVAQGIAEGRFAIGDLTDEAVEFFMQVGKSSMAAADSFEYMNPRILETGQGLGDGFSSAEEKMRSFANAREELFFGGRSQYMSGEMMKQVVNKGVENLYSNVELLMTNNFFGLTMDEAISEISSNVTRQLIEQGVPLRQV